MHFPTVNINLNNRSFWDKLPPCAHECAKLGFERPAGGGIRRLRPDLGRGYISLRSLVSSMFMSLNSRESNTSRHSRHSTYSASSSRETIWTRGCLHGFMFLLLSEAGWGGIEFIDPVWFRKPFGRPNNSPDFRYFSPANGLVKSLAGKFYALGAGTMKI